MACCDPGAPPQDATDMADWITILVTHPGEARASPFATIAVSFHRQI